MQVTAAEQCFQFVGQFVANESWVVWWILERVLHNCPIYLLHTYYQSSRIGYDY